MARGKRTLLIDRSLFGWVSSWDGGERGECSFVSVCPPSAAAAVPLVNTHAAPLRTEQGRPPRAYTRDASRVQLISAPISTENFISEGEPTRAILDGFNRRTGNHDIAPVALPLTREIRELSATLVLKSAFFPE